MSEVIRFPRNRWVHHFDKVEDLFQCQCDDCLEHMRELMIPVLTYEDIEYTQFPPIDDPDA